MLYPKSDEQYSCEAQHPGLIKPLKASALINILRPPSALPIIDGYKEGDIVQVGETISLTCISKGGFPPPKVVWHRNGVLVDQSFILNNRNDVINTYQFVVSVDDNQANYSCAVSNNLTQKPLVAQIKLNVLCELWNLLQLQLAFCCHLLRHLHRRIKVTVARAKNFNIMLFIFLSHSLRSPSGEN